MKNTVFVLFLLFILTNCNMNTFKESKGYEAHKDGDYETAINIWQELLEKKPNNAKYLNNLGWAYLHIDNIDSAEKSFLKAKQNVKSSSLKNSIEINIDMFDLVLKVQEFYNEEQFENCIEKIVKIDPKSQIADILRYYQAKCYLEMDNKKEAKEVLLKTHEKYHKTGVFNKYYLHADSIINAL